MRLKITMWKGWGGYITILLVWSWHSTVCFFAVIGRRQLCWGGQGCQFRQRRYWTICYREGKQNKAQLMSWKRSLQCTLYLSTLSLYTTAHRLDSWGNRFQGTLGITLTFTLLNRMIQNLWSSQISLFIPKKNPLQILCAFLFI